MTISPVNSIRMGFTALSVRIGRKGAGATGRYVGGVIRPDAPLDLPDDTRIRMRIEVMPEGAPGGDDPPAMPDDAQGAPRLEWILFGLALLVYAFTRLYALERFPIYFFADEATHAVLASDLLQNGFRDMHGRLFPLYFEAAGLRWTPLLSVYVHVLPVALFGKSIAVTRATAALVTLAGVAAVALTARLIFRCRYWWTAVLFLALAPNWLLHSRTGFETVMMASFYALFLLFYLLYRTRAPAYLYPAVVFGAATFYTYSNGQMVMAATAVLLLLSDLPYHLRHWKTVLLGLGLVAVLALPILRFRLTQPDSLPQHLRAIDSYWFRDISLTEKLRQFVRTYAYGLSPQYWFLPNQHDLARHRFRGAGASRHLRAALLPRRVGRQPCPRPSGDLSGGVAVRAGCAGRGGAGGCDDHPRDGLQRARRAVLHPGVGNDPGVPCEADPRHTAGESGSLRRSPCSR